jgi:signal transduction histidine kinase
MTHEIMNSVAPISSLAGTLKKRLQSNAAEGSGDNSSLEDLELGIDTIQRRSEGLLKFAETYRNLNKITTLNLQKVYIRELFGNLHQLMQPTFEQKGIEFEIIFRDPELHFQADINLLEQVFINLIVNAIEAVKETATPKIVLSAELTLSNKVILKVADNGQGMPEEVMEKIFIPFFSTKKNGSGIGLSLCKQIIMLHRGTLSVQSKEREGTVFIMQFG